MADMGIGAMIKPLTWAQEQRIAWIKESVEIFGNLNRQHIMKKFRVSTPQASADLRLFRSLHPDVIEYDSVLKIYRRKDKTGVE